MPHTDLYTSRTALCVFVGYLHNKVKFCFGILFGQRMKCFLNPHVRQSIRVVSTEDLQSAKIWILPITRAKCVALDKSLDLSESHFPYLQDGN